MDTNTFLQRDKFAVHLGIELLEAGNGKAKAKLVLTDEHMNGVDYAHGGVVFSLADFTLAAAANSRGNLALSINSSISFVKAIRKDTLYAEAIETSKNPKLATYMVNVTDEQGSLVATMQGMVYRKKENY